MAVNSESFVESIVYILGAFEQVEISTSFLV